MKTYDIHYFKTENLSSDERNAMRKNQSGIWLMGPAIKAETPQKACAIARKEYGYKKCRARA